jgi:hypothetical protein
MNEVSHPRYWRRAPASLSREQGSPVRGHAIPRSRGAETISHRLLRAVPNWIFLARCAFPRGRGAAPVRQATDPRIPLPGASLLWRRAVIRLSTRSLHHPAGLTRTHRQQPRSPRRRLVPTHSGSPGQWRHVHPPARPARLARRATPCPRPLLRSVSLQMASRFEGITGHRTLLCDWPAAAGLNLDAGGIPSQNRVGWEVTA